METLTVVFIIGLVTSGILLLVPPDDRPLDQEAERLELAVRTLTDRAVFTGSVQGLLVWRDGYQGMQYQSGAWVRLRQFRRELPDGIRIFNFEQAEGEVPQYLLDPIGIPSEGGLQLSNGSDAIDVLFSEEAAS